MLTHRRKCRAIDREVRKVEGVWNRVMRVLMEGEGAKDLEKGLENRHGVVELQGVDERKVRMCCGCLFLPCFSSPLFVYYVWFIIAWHGVCMTV